MSAERIFPYGGGTLASGADLSAKKGYGAKTMTAPVLATAGAVKGVIIDGGAASGDNVVIAGPGSVCKALLGGTVAAGDALSTDANGKWVVAGSGVHAAASAYQAGTDGTWIDVFVNGIDDEVMT